MTTPITLYSADHCPFSHRSRLVFCEKEMEPEKIISVDLARKPEELWGYNPLGQVPVLIDGNLRLYESNVINEYLDGRFPHPQLMPVDIVLRAKVRLMMNQLETLVFRHVLTLEAKKTSKQRAEECKKRICEELVRQFADLPRHQRYIIDREFTMLDVALAPLLWRLEHYQITLPPRTVALRKYAERVFSRPAFARSLTVTERAMRK